MRGLDRIETDVRFCGVSIGVGGDSSSLTLGSCGVFLYFLSVFLSCCFL